MGKDTYVGPVLLLDNYGDASRMLHESFVQAGYDGPVVVVDDDGFLPNGVLSVYQALCGEDDASEQGKPRYFNQIPVPDYWEIAATGLSAKVLDQDCLRARVFYTEPLHERLVGAVDWLDREGNTRFCDHYNRSGRLFARTTFDKKGQRFCKTYFSREGKEAVIENFGTHSIEVMLDGKSHYFRRVEELVPFVFEREGIVATRLFYNSLGAPLFAAGNIAALNGNHVLFWQEPIRDEIPGNMVSVMSEDRWDTDAICVQSRASYDRLIELGADGAIVKPLGFVYEYAKENNRTPNALVCTNSEDVEKLEELAVALPEVQFNVAALTEMSSKLMSTGRHANIHLYPTVKTEVLDKLFMECDIYLDINHYSEIVSAVKQAFLHNHLILAFKDTLHNETYVAPGHVYTGYEKMAEVIKSSLAEPREMRRHLDAQRTWALSEDVSAYARILEKKGAHEIPQQ